TTPAKPARVLGEILIWFSSVGKTGLKESSARIVGKARSRNKGTGRTLSAEKGLVLMPGMEKRLHLSAEEGSRPRNVWSESYVQISEMGAFGPAGARLLALECRGCSETCARSGL